MLLLLSITAAAPAMAGGRHTETFVVEPSGYMAATLADGGFVAPFPAGIPRLDEPAIRDGLILLAKLEDAAGNVVGFASEHDVLDLANAVSDDTWTLTIPGRGTLFLSHVETLAPLLSFLSEMIASGQLERTWDPPYVLTTTVPRTGKVVGGTGEFAHVHGRFREIDALRHLSLLTGALEVTDTLVVDFDGE
jgi:hypothetical protein